MISQFKTKLSVTQGNEESVPWSPKLPRNHTGSYRDLYPFFLPPFTLQSRRIPLWKYMLIRKPTQQPKKGM